MRKVFVAAFAATVVGCATSFTGSAHVDGGPSGCMQKCREWGQEFVGMVAMGEYSDACICRVQGKAVALEDASSATTAAAAGVMMQMQRAQQQQHAAR